MADVTVCFEISGPISKSFSASKKADFTIFSRNFGVIVPYFKF